MNRPLRVALFLVPVAVLAALVVLAALPSGRETPEEAFAEALAMIRSGDYDGVWFRHHEDFRRSWETDMEGYDRIVRGAGPNRTAIDGFLDVQFGTDSAGFLGMTPRERFTAFLARNRERLLRFRAVGPVEVHGDTATMDVEVDEERHTQEWTFRLVDGEWLILSTPKPGGSLRQGVR